MTRMLKRLSSTQDWVFVRILQSVFVFLNVLFLSSAASAHSADQSYVYFHVTDESLTGRIEATFGDLSQVIPLDENKNGTITQEEVTQNADAVFEYLSSNIKIESQGQEFELEPLGIDYLDVEWDTFALVKFSVANMPIVPDEIDVTYTAFFNDVNSDHQALGIIASNSRTGLEENESQISVVFAKDASPKTVSLVGKPWPELLGIFIYQGMLHIWFGFDHVLFLITLLIPSVMVIRSGRWKPAEGIRGPLFTVLQLVTGFTVAHSITLSLAALDVVRLPGAFVESVIALSIAFVALTIIVPSLHKGMFWTVVLFGLFHGFGFANVLAPINIEPNQKFITLGGFNIGVELGQIAIVLVVFPLLYILRNTRFYQFWVMKVGAVALIFIALFWFEERAFDMMGPLVGNLKGWLAL
ncbi:MAG: HupE/UreJ family protein [Marinosulfonomonas sp.]